MRVGLSGSLLPCDGPQFLHLTSQTFEFFFWRETMSFGIYAVGYLILIAGVTYLAHLMHIPSHYIIAIALIMLGIGVVTGVQTTRHKDPS
jgi:hypothetical protein